MEIGRKKAQTEHATPDPVRSAARAEVDRATRVWGHKHPARCFLSRRGRESFSGEERTTWKTIGRKRLPTLPTWRVQFVRVNTNVLDAVFVPISRPRTLPSYSGEACVLHVPPPRVLRPLASIVRGRAQKPQTREAIRPEGAQHASPGQGDASRASAAAAPGNGVRIESSP